MARRSIDDAELRDVLQEANLPTLLAALAHLTGDDSWLTGRFRPEAPRGVEDHDSAGLSPELQRAAREEAFGILRSWLDGDLNIAPAPSPEEIARLLALSLGSTQPMPVDIGPLLAEELGVLGRDVHFPETAGVTSSSPKTVLVIGAGLSGLCAAIKLKDAGADFLVVEKDDAIGGTWLENTYPGCGVDTPSCLYSFSFAQSPDWSRYFAKRDELHEYLEQLTEMYDLRGHIRFGTEVISAAWDDHTMEWGVELRDGTGRVEVLRRDVVVSAVGLLNRPARPAIPGLETFAGPVMHTAQWRQDVDLREKCVAVIGTGASAMQLVPAIADVAGHVRVFQRSPQWGLPSANYMRPMSDRTQRLMDIVPYYMGWYRLRQVWNFGDRLYPALQIDPEWPHPDRAVNRINDRHREFLTKYILSELGDRTDLIDKCIPTYPPYGKRPLLDNGWFRTMTRDDVQLHDEDISEIRPHSIVTADGTEHEVDVLVLATGFQAVRVLGPIEIRGKSGRTLRDTWGKDDARAYLGISIPDFPNLFLLLGPNTFAAHGGSAALTIEMEVRYIMSILAHMAAEDIGSVECRRDVYDSYDEKLTGALQRTIWSHTGMTTYYRNDAGRIVIPMPWTNVDFWHMTHDADMDDYLRTPRQLAMR
jgi:4-hydroxyacetophenone monooxygenase